MWPNIGFVNVYKCNSTENIRMMFVAKMRFKDSIQFFMDSLDNLAGAMTPVRKDKVVEQLSEYLFKNNELGNIKLTMFESDYDLTKEKMIAVLAGKEPSVVREG